MSRSGRRAILRRLPFYRRRRLVVAMVVAILIVVRAWQDLSRPEPPESLSEGTYIVKRVVDGDTLVLAGGARLRLIGADTPETVKPGHPVEPFGPEATQFTQRFVADANDRIRLQLDRERLDKYGRFLGYVWASDRMLNEELIRAGLATAETGFRYSSSMKTRFRRAEEEAKAAGRGIWSR